MVNWIGVLRIMEKIKATIFLEDGPDVDNPMFILNLDFRNIAEYQNRKSGWRWETNEVYNFLSFLGNREGLIFGPGNGHTSNEAAIHHISSTVLKMLKNNKIGPENEFEFEVFV